MIEASVIVLSVVIGLFGFLVFYVSKLLKSNHVEDDQSDDVNDLAEEKSKLRNGDHSSNAKASQGDGTKKKTADKKAATHGKDRFTHPWLISTLKGHSGNVLDLDLSENGKYLASCSTDRSVLIWMVKEFFNKEHKTHRGNVSYDMATKVKWSPDSRAFIVHKASANCAEVYKINKKEDGSNLGTIEPIVTYPVKHDTDVIGLGFAPTGKYCMSCSDKTTLIIWSIKGDVLASVDTYQMNTYCAKVSPCGRFVATSGFTPDVKVWEVKFSRTGEFEKIHRAFELTGHTSGVFHFSYNADSSRVVTLGKDCKWRLYNVNIEFERGQDPSCLQQGTYEGSELGCLIALSGDAQAIAIAKNTTITWFSTVNSQKLGEIDQVHSVPINCLVFDKESRWLLSAGDRHIRVFKNVPGLKCKMIDLQEKLKSASTEAMKERLKQQIKDIQNNLTGM